MSKEDMIVGKKLNASVSLELTQPGNTYYAWLKTRVPLVKATTANPYICGSRKTE